MRLRLFALAFFLPLAAQADLPTPPEQPATGPGGKEAPFGDVAATHYGAGSAEYWILEPREPRPAHAPVIVFLHGWSVMDTIAYQAWLNHLVRRGSIVVYPRYHADRKTRAVTFTGNAEQAVKAAFVELKTGDHVRPEWNHVAFAGHSMGGMIAANLAARADGKELPHPKALFCAMPGKIVGDYPIQNDDLAKVPAGTLLVTVAGDSDPYVGDFDARRIWRGTTAIAEADKNFVILHSDAHGHRPLVANHFAPCALVSNAIPFYSRKYGIDALDWYGTWKLLDGLTDAAFYGQGRAYALGNTARQRFMGRWSDGTPVTPLEVVARP
jgi:pimeloyl-ACP methyl ester carboxylesterase